MEITTISLDAKTKDRIEKLKVHPNQSFDEILNEIVDLYEKK